MNCPDCLDRLQQQLDGAATPDRDLLDAHLAGCRDCRERFAAAQRLAEGLRTLPPPAPPAALADRIVAAVLRQRRARQRLRRWLLAGAAAAAALLAATLAGFLRPGAPAPGPRPEPPRALIQREPKQPVPTPALPPLRESVAEARSAVTALTEDLAARTRAQARLLLSAAAPLDPMAVPPLPGVAGLEEPLEPAARSLRESGHGVSTSLETVAGSARRAWSYFLHELPLETRSKAGL
jgi:predicted anti-sigma-YlaC factor YlaD